MALPKGDVFTGARARFTVNGKVIGFATDCTGSEEIQYEPINVLDNIQVQEFVPIGYTVSFNASRVRLVNRSVKSPEIEIFPRTGKDPQEHLRNILQIGTDFSAVIEDSVTGQIIMLLEQVKVASHNFSVRARGVVGEDMNFVAIRMRDETDQLG